MTIGAGALYAIALKYFVLPSKVILTGTEGIASALSYYFDSFLAIYRFVSDLSSYIFEFCVCAGQHYVRDATTLRPSADACNLAIGSADSAVYRP
jgi:hypothetical protein